MNTCQRWVLGLGLGVILTMLALGTSHSPGVGPVVEQAPGQYSRDVTDAFLPRWVLLTTLGLAMLIGAALYQTRTVRKTP